MKLAMTELQADWHWEHTCKCEYKEREEMAIWDDKRKEREERIADLMLRLEELNTDQAKLLIGALDYYGTNKAKLPHADWVKIRGELLDKAEALLGVE